MAKIYKTDRFIADLKRIYRRSFEEFGFLVAEETREKFEKIESLLIEYPELGQPDPEFHSGRFRHLNVRTHKVFYEIIDGDVYLVTAGWSGRNWKEIFKDLEALIDQELGKF